MNDIDKMPVKCRDCPYWELAASPWCCGDCKDRLKKPVSDFVSRQWLIDEYHRRHEGPPGGALKMIEEAPAAEVGPKRRWIPVTEGLPVGGDDSGDICENVCLMLDDGTVSCGWMNGITKKVYFLNARDDFIIKAPITRVTHWMPLPEPPKEADDGEL